MEHLRQIDLIELASERLCADRRADAEVHLAACAECRERLDAVRQTWQTLGKWRVAAGRDLEAEIVRAAGRQAQTPPIPAWRRRASPVIRVAAAILLAAGIGHAAGRWARPQSTGSPPVLTEADERAAAEALSLDILAQQSAAGLAEAVIDLSAPAQEAQP